MTQTPEQIAADPKDICVCGDWRSDHVDGTGACLFNANRFDMCHGGENCYQFRLHIKAHLPQQWRQQSRARIAGVATGHDPRTQALQDAVRHARRSETMNQPQDLSDGLPLFTAINGQEIAVIDAGALRELQRKAMAWDAAGSNGAVVAELYIMADHLDGYAGGHHMAKSCAVVLRDRAVAIATFGE